ncbi:amidohydrolase, partial [Escherichia coli]|nr:amidohydrolase [Escherichia coli]
MGRPADPVEERISSYLDEMVALRHDLHQNPELGYNEHRTSALVAGRLRDWGYQVTAGVGKTGV